MLTNAWGVMTDGVRVLAADPGANKLFTAAFTCTQEAPLRLWPVITTHAFWERARQTLSSERTEEREGEEGSSSPRGFFGLGGLGSADVVAEEASPWLAEGSGRDTHAPQTGEANFQHPKQRRYPRRSDHPKCACVHSGELCRQLDFKQKANIKLWVTATFDLRLLHPKVGHK